MIVAVEKNLLRYVPKNLRRYCTWLTREQGEYARYVYFGVFEKDGIEYPMENADSVAEITWNCKEVAKEMGVKLGR